jgi:hypothetical protein
MILSSRSGTGRIAKERFGPRPWRSAEKRKMLRTKRGAIEEVSQIESTEICIVSVSIRVLSQLMQSTFSNT